MDLIVLITILTFIIELSDLILNYLTYKQDFKIIILVL